MKALGFGDPYFRVNAQSLKPQKFTTGEEELMPSTSRLPEIEAYYGQEEAVGRRPALTAPEGFGDMSAFSSSQYSGARGLDYTFSNEVPNVFPPPNLQGILGPGIGPDPNIDYGKLYGPGTQGGVNTGREVYYPPQDEGEDNGFVNAITQGGTSVLPYMINILQGKSVTGNIGGAIGTVLGGEKYGGVAGPAGAMVGSIVGGTPPVTALSQGLPTMLLGGIGSLLKGEGSDIYNVFSPGISQATPFISNALTPGVANLGSSLGLWGSEAANIASAGALATQAAAGGATVAGSTGALAAAGGWAAPLSFLGQIVGDYFSNKEGPYSSQQLAEWSQMTESGINTANEFITKYPGQTPYEWAPEVEKLGYKVWAPYNVKDLTVGIGPPDAYNPRPSLAYSQMAEEGFEKTPYTMEEWQEIYKNPLLGGLRVFSPGDAYKVATYEGGAGHSLSDFLPASELEKWGGTNLYQHSSIGNPVFGSASPSPEISYYLNQAALPNQLGEKGETTLNDWYDYLRKVNYEAGINSMYGPA